MRCGLVFTSVALLALAPNSAHDASPRRRSPFKSSVSTNRERLRNIPSPLPTQPSLQVRDVPINSFDLACRSAPAPGAGRKRLRSRHGRRDWANGLDSDSLRAAYLIKAARSHITNRGAVVRDYTFRPPWRGFLGVEFLRTTKVVRWEHLDPLQESLNSSFLESSEA